MTPTHIEGYAEQKISEEHKNTLCPSEIKRLVELRGFEPLTF
jgi:hypothetical protein